MQLVSLRQSNGSPRATCSSKVGSAWHTMMRILLVHILAVLPLVATVPPGPAAGLKCPPDVAEVLGTDERGEAVCGCTQSSNSGGTLCVGPKGECRWGRRSDAAAMQPREPTNKHEKKQYWEALKKLPWQEKISKATPSLWPSREKVEGFHPACGAECTCASSCNKIVFIIGCGHSGTTYMTRLLGAS